MYIDIIDLLNFAVKKNASQVLLSPDSSPMLRIDGKLKKIKMPVLSYRDVHEILYDFLGEYRIEITRESLFTEVSYDIPGIGRFLCSAFRSHDDSDTKFVSGIFTHIKEDYKLSFNALNYPPVFKKIAEQQQGLILVTGSTKLRMDKSQIIAALINHRNNTFSNNIMTVENPILQVHESKKSLIQQQEFNRDIFNYYHSMSNVRFSSPDVFMIDQFDNLNSLEKKEFLLLASSGLLAITALPSTSVIDTLNYIDHCFPESDKSFINELLSESLRAIIHIDAFITKENIKQISWEIMVNTKQISPLIRDGDYAAIFDIMYNNKQDIVTIEHSLE
ncbi:MAG: hypothetical protein HQL46_13305 [Gammaproteobacteria bacterium]|nr:hypothetical protein [Gammaproteobacteria bacterium]